MKSKLGISIGLLAAAAYFLGLVGGYIPMLLVVGYILLHESNRWLKVSAVKAVIVCIFFSLLSVFIGFIPDIFEFIRSAAGIFQRYPVFLSIPSLASFLLVIVDILKKVLLIVLGIKAMTQKSFTFSFADNIIGQHFPFVAGESQE
jgi:uncharacterized membrane protein